MIEEVTGKGVRIVRHGLKKHGITRSDCIHTSWFGLVLSLLSASVAARVISRW